MIPADSSVILQSGETLTAGEIFEGLALLARNYSPYPLLVETDGTKAILMMSFEALEWARERNML